MSRSELSQFSYGVLALIGRNGAGPHDLVQYARRGRVYERSADSQYYAEPKRLAALGYLKAEKQPGKTRERTHYTLTKKGLQALRDWMNEPCSFTGIDSDAILRMLAADLVGEGRVRKSLLPLREEIDDLNGRLDEAERAAASYPHREKYLLLNHSLARAILRAYSRWLDEVERKLEPRKAESSKRALPGRSGAARRKTSRRSR